MKAQEVDLQGFQPGQKVVVGSPARGSFRLGHWLCFGEGRTLGLEIDRGVLMRAVDAFVSQPVGDGAEINPGFEQINGGAVPNTVGVDALALEHGQDG